ncbi:MAG: phosphatase PAP2 family protein [Bacteroidota bacterium]
MRYYLLLLLIVIRLTCCVAQQDTTRRTGNFCGTSQRALRNNIIALSIPVALITYGSLCTNNNGFPSSHDVKKFRDNHFSTFKNYTDDYLLYSNAALVYGFDLLKIPAKNDVLNQSIIMAKTTVLALGIAGIMKYSFTQTRPDRSDNLSFPSGHSALAFALAGVLHHEFKDSSPWISVLGYTSATVTGAMRILNNRHWYSDVLVGAGIGMLSTNIVYLTHRNKYSNSSLKRSVCLPIIGTNYYGLSWQKSF